MEPEGSLPRSEEFANCPCPELYEPIHATIRPPPPILFLEDPF